MSHARRSSSDRPHDEGTSLTTPSDTAADLAPHFIQDETEVYRPIMSAGMKLGGFPPVAEQLLLLRQGQCCTGLHRCQAGEHLRQRFAAPRRNIIPQPLHKPPTDSIGLA